jgi:Leucine-rich repeat (LRR) protein
MGDDFLNKFEEDTIQLSESGAIDARNKSWTVVNSYIFKFGMNLIVLDISNNYISSLPKEIGSLLFLRDLRASFNLLSRLPTEIGKCRSLRRLILNGNRLEFLCEEVGQLHLLEELVLSENFLEEIPPTIPLLHSLRVLKLQANHLKSLPLTIANMVTLEDIDCTNNPDLHLISDVWKNDTKSLQAVCRIHQGMFTTTIILLINNLFFHSLNDFHLLS